MFAGICLVYLVGLHLNMSDVKGPRNFRAKLRYICLDEWYIRFSNWIQTFEYIN